MDPPALTVEKSFDTEFIFFIKTNPSNKSYNKNIIERQVLHAPVKPNFVVTLLKLMDDVYNPQIYND